MNKKSNYKVRGTIFTVIGGFFLLFGIPFLLVGSILGAVFNSADKSVTARTTGIIEEVTQKSGSDSDYSGYAVVAFEVGGKSYEITSSYASSTFRVNGKVDVMYDPENPQNAVVKVPEVLNIMFRVFQYGGIFCMVIGVAGVSVGIWHFVRGKKSVEIPGDIYGQ